MITVCQKCLVIEIYSRLDCDIVLPGIRSPSLRVALGLQHRDSSQAGPDRGWCPIHEVITIFIVYRLYVHSVYFVNL